MPLNLKLPVFDVGVEIEFFLTREHQVFFARHLFEEHLGYSIDQNNGNDRSLYLGGGFNLCTDGTAAELRWYAPNNGGHLPGEWISRLRGVHPLDRYTLSYKPFLREGSLMAEEATHPIEFVQPGTVYNSGKQLINAYTGEVKEGKKKPKGRNVTMRTAGTHLHFSVSHQNISWEDQIKLSKFIFTPGSVHTNALVKIMDETYTDLIAPRLGPLGKEREKIYQKMGDYRIKASGNESGLPTIEYRQFNSDVARTDWRDIQTFITFFQLQAIKYLRSL